jgi:hypothetical protein
MEWLRQCNAEMHEGCTFLNMHQQLDDLVILKRKKKKTAETRINPEIKA